MNKAFTFPRFMAYLIDVIIISIVASLLGFVLPTQNTVTNLREEYSNLQESYLNQEITADQYLSNSKDLVYEIDYNVVPETIMSIILVIGYYIIFQFYNGGQTIGKKIMKVKIVSNNGKELGINNYLYRSVILNGLLFNIINLILIMFASKNCYFYASFSLQMIQFVLLLITILMVLFRKNGRGLHDMVANTKVVMED